MVVPSQDFKRGMRHLAAAVNVIASGAGSKRQGFTATAVMSLTAEPPLLAVAVNRQNGAFDVIRTTRCFSINTLAHDQTNVALCFSGATGLKGEARFERGLWSRGVTGAPILSESAVSFDCHVDREIEFSTHSLFVGAIAAVTVGFEKSPLLYVNGDWAYLASTDSAHGNRIPPDQMGLLSADEVLQPEVL